VLLLLTGCGADAARSSVPLEAGRDNVRGAANAPVIIEEWADYQCPACGSFVRLQPQLDQNVLADGRARLVFRNMAFLGQESIWAAESAECAGDQGRYWDYHDVLYASQNGENRGAFRIERLKQFAASVQLDQAAFDTCLDTHAYANRVRQETQRGQRLSVNSTPTVFVNGQRVVFTSGRSPIDILQAAVQSAR
jgi:protein-disulfide isomerase